MKKLSMVVMASLFSLAGYAHAQDRTTGIVESTDPSKAAAVEEHARELQAQQSGASSSMQGASGTSKASKGHHRSASKSRHGGTSSSGGDSAGTSGGGSSK